MNRTYEQIKEQVGTVTGNPPGAWWVGTDKTLALRDEYLAARKADGDRRAELAKSVDANPDKTWSYGRGERIAGFVPNDFENVHKALREDKNTSGMWVPNRRTKAGKELVSRMEEVNTQAVSTDSIAGVSGGISTSRDGGLYRIRPAFQIVKDKYPFVYTSKNPDDHDAAPCMFYGELTIDPELWERVPASWIMRIIEESEQEGAQQ